jgi:uncharacterized protein YdaU (DUF1376 family)
MSIQKPEWFKVDAAKFLSDARVDAMSTLELGACFRLLCRQWLDGAIPDDPRLLARLCRLDEATMREAWLTLCDFFPVVEPGKRANRFMWIEREKVIADLERRSDEGTRAANKRWNEARKNRGDAIPITTPNGSPMPEPMQDQTRPDTDQTRPDKPAAALSRALKKQKSTEDSMIRTILETYPRRIAPAKTCRAIEKAILRVSKEKCCSRGDAADFIYAAVLKFCESPAGQKGEYTPYPATWMNEDRFFDDPAEWWKVNANGNSSSGQTDAIRNVADRLAHELG